MKKRYEASQFEEKIYSQWEKAGVFKPKDQGESFCIIMPPPNANDPLHVGHAMFVTVEDILTRYQRMRGKAALWLPGTDHAGIETQYVFEKKLRKKGKSRFDYDRKTLFKMIWDYVEENSGVAIEQMKRLGASADWSRIKFTLDKEIVERVIETFKELHEEGLVYRSKELVNYCDKCGTSFSNLEVRQVEQKDKLYYVKYRVKGEKKWVTVATVRPETIFADVAIAINPKDKRARELRGKKVINPLTQREMPIIEDNKVDLEFGTGMVKITPAHDFNDFEIGKKHKLEILEALRLDKNGRWRMSKLAGKLEGMKVEGAREKVRKDLETEKIEDYEHTVGRCYRCNQIIEPYLMPQFFIKVKPLTEKALKAMKEKQVKIYGAGQEKILKHWLRNLKDWNISRQIVWGIQMPVWYCGGKRGDCYVVSEEKPKKCNKCRAKEFVQETDTFDTWFSSAQWPYVTLMTGEKDDFKRFYPTEVMETGYDILPFWVMRMLMMGIYKTGKVPFKKVYLHGLVRDEKGQKMSKSKGNVVNPIEVVEKYGADALRMSLVMSTTAGKDSATGEGKIRGMRNLTNKIWNAVRFCTEFLEKRKETGEEDEKFEERLKEVAKEITKQLEELKPGLAAETVYNEFWHWFCDEVIEKAKEGKVSYPRVMKGLKTFLKLLHPFVPFVTEAVWQELGEKKMLIEVGWPEVKE